MRSFKHIKDNNITFYVECTQKECIDYLNATFDFTKKYLTDFIKASKKIIICGITWKRRDIKLHLYLKTIKKIH